MIGAPVGISRLRVYPGALVVDMRALVAARGGDVAEVCDRMMITERSLNPPWEDPVTMAVEATRSLLSPREREDVGLLLVGSESGLDQEKSLSTWIQRYAGLPDDLIHMEVKSACYAGSGALRLAAAWLLTQPPHKTALVVTTDQSRAHFRRPYEFVMGAGAAAMLISREPTILELEPGCSGVFTHEVSDLIRPTSRVEAGHSETSLLSYLDAVDTCFERYAAAVARSGAGALDSGDAARAWMPLQIYHAPFGGITQRAHRALFRSLEGFDARAVGRDFDLRVAPTLRYNRRMGGTYASSVFISLLGALDAFGAAAEGQRVGIYSYGSGSMAEFYSGRVGRGAAAAARAAGLLELLDARRPASIRDYEEAERERECYIDRGDYRVSLDGHGGLFGRDYEGRGRLVFLGSEGYVRQYAWS